MIKKKLMSTQLIALCLLLQLISESAIGASESIVDFQRSNRTTIETTKYIFKENFKNSATCTNPLEFTRLPNSYSSDAYASFREACTNKCNAEGYCCTGGFGGCNVVPCNEACHIAFFTDDVAACKAECTRANSLNCEYLHSQHYQIAFLGYYDWWPDHALEKCWGALECGCPTDDFGKDCEESACARGCELANSSDLRDQAFNGESAIVDRHLNSGVSSSDLRSAIGLIHSHVDGSSPLTNQELRAARTTFEANSIMLDMDFDSMNDALALIDEYENAFGGLFTDSKTNPWSYFFPAEDSDDGYTLQRVMLVVQQAIFDEVYRGTASESAPQDTKSHDSIIENCKDYLRGRYWKTSAHFPGSLQLPNEQSSTVHSIKIDATVEESWGTPECFSDSPRIHATGLYLPPGGVAWVTFPEALVDKNFQIQVGANDPNFDWKDQKFRMDRITTSYEVKDVTTYVASPLGGGIYIKVPYLANFGNRVIRISGDVIEAPFFSMTNRKTTTRAEWNQLMQSEAPWTDFESDFYMQTVPTSWITTYDFDHFKNLMESRDMAMKAVQFIGGNPVNKRNKHVLYLLPDVQIRASAFGVGYPQVNSLVGFDENGGFAPDSDHYLVSEPFLNNDVEYHEKGHCLWRDTSYYRGEIEALVNFVHAYVMSNVGGQDFDYAFSYSMGGATGILTPDDAAVDWMVTVNFREGNEMENEGEAQEFQYQPRGYAKYADLCTLFGCEILYNFFYQENLDYEQHGDIEFGIPEGYDSNDFRTLRLSIQAGVDLTPLMHFWGIHPKDSARLKASMNENNLQVSMEVHDLIKNRLEMIPKTKAKFLEFFRRGWPGKENPEPWECPYECCDCGFYIYWKDRWNQSIANKAIAAGQAILDLYYDDISPTAPTPTAPTPTAPTPTAPTPTAPTPTAPTPTAPTPTAPTPTPPTNTSCSDSPVRFKLQWNGKNIFRSCVWVANKATAMRCKSAGVSAMCSSTCGTCSTCADSTNRMKIRFNGKLITRDCNWVKNKSTNQRCRAEGVEDACRETCGKC